MSILLSFIPIRLCLFESDCQLNTPDDIIPYEIIFILFKCVSLPLLTQSQCMFYGLYYLPRVESLFRFTVSQDILCFVCYGRFCQHILSSFAIGNEKERDVTQKLCAGPEDTYPFASLFCILGFYSFDSKSFLFLCFKIYRSQYCHIICFGTRKYGSYKAETCSNLLNYYYVDFIVIKTSRNGVLLYGF